MKRREFIRVVGGVSVVSALAPDYGFSVPSLSQHGVLLEASSFENRGGWLLDTQFYQQMGGSYLLAHGLGKPVKNAVTEVVLPESGVWHIFVRTKDWCPGNWAAPGRFRVKLNGSMLDTVFGTGPGWGWQRGGAVTLPDGRINVELQDLTGFEGRVDAIYFSRSGNPELPADTGELVGWKDQLTGRSKLKVNSSRFDLVIVGGGIAGCAAALAAESRGLSVALIQDRPLFGGNASREIRVHTEGIHGKGAEILKKIDTVHWPNGSAEAVKDQKKRDEAMRMSSVQLFPGYLAVGLARSGKQIVSVDARDTRSGIIRRFRAPLFIDCTGDGWLGYWAGARYRYGREASSEYQEKWDKYGKLWSPSQADNRVMGASVLWNSFEDKTASSFPDVPWARPVAGEAAAVNGEWYWEYSDNKLNQIKNAEEIRDHLFRAIYGNFSNAKKREKHKYTTLKWVSHLGGKRESRRLLGDYVYSMKDAAERRSFPDAVVEERRPIDCHYQLKEKGHPADYLSEALYYDPEGLYYVPFRSLYSRDITNLMMAGRCFSCTHIGLSGPRVMNTCGQMGIATGYAASLCKKYSVPPREIGKIHIKELRRLIGYS